MRRKHLLLTVSGLVSLVASAGSVSAQESESIALEEIVVTAQKREERLQDVPISITAMSGEDLANRGSTGLLELQYSVPGLSAMEYGPGQERVQMRGISNLQALNTVGRYLDEMPINTEIQATSLDLRLLDMERVEVLRGPQGTLYGEGSMGGTIRYVTASPNLSNYSADLEAQAGAVTDGGTSERASATVNLPLVNDRLGLRLVAGYEKQAGWIDNTATGQKDVNDAVIRTFRGKMLSKLGENIEASLLVLHQQSDQDAQNFGIDRRTTALVPEYSNADYDLVNAIVRWDLGWADLVNSAGWAEEDYETQNDFSPFYVPVLTAPLPGGLGLPVGFISAVGFANQGEFRVVTDELRLSSKPGDRLDWTVGLYGRDSKQVIAGDAITSPGSMPFDLLNSDAIHRSKSWAAFGQLDLHVTDKLTGSVGLRWFSDERSFDSLSSNFGFVALDQMSDTFKSLNPRFNLQYEFSPESMVYVNAAKGFRSGGFNLTSAGGGITPIPPTYDPEKLWSYEIGTKQQWLGRRLIVEGAVYYNDWKDVQSSYYAPNSTVTVIESGGNVKGLGVDLSLLARPIAGLSLTATYGWNDMEYKTATADKLPGDPVDLAIRESWSLSADYSRPLFGDVNGFARFDYQHAAEGQVTLRNFAGQVIVVPERDLLNVRLGLDFGRFEAALFVENLTDEDAPILPGPFGIFTQNVEQRPRTVGANLKARF